MFSVGASPNTAARTSVSSLKKTKQNSRVKSGSRRNVVQTFAKKTPDGPRVCIAGVTGAVGQEFLRVLKQRDFPYSEMKMLASSRSAGKEVEFDGETYTTEELTETSFDNMDIALFSAGGSISKKFGPIAVEKGCYVVDNSSAFRMTEGVPLVIPEVNPEAMAGMKIGSGKGGIIANPNCSTIIALMATTAIQRKVGIERMVVSTYQAASGAGAQAMAELEQQTRELVNDGEVKTKEIFPWGYAFNLFSHNAPMMDNGYNEEEMKMVKETKKIWNTDDISICATCIRVPVMRAHAESINLTLKNDLSEEEARKIISEFPGVSLIDDRANNRFPMPSDASDQDDCFVGRIRRDISQKGNKGLELFVCGNKKRCRAKCRASRRVVALIDFYFILSSYVERERERETCVFLKRQKIRDLQFIKFALYFITYNTHATFIIMLTTTEKMTTEALAGTFCAFFSLSFCLSYS